MSSTEGTRQVNFPRADSLSVFLHQPSNPTLTLYPGDPLDKLKFVADIIVALKEHLSSHLKIGEWIGLDID